MSKTNEWQQGKTGRGFPIIRFRDRNEDSCSIQDSSLATEFCIWLGIDDAKPQIMVSDAKRLGISTTKDFGWMPYSIPEEVLLTTRMHLTVEDAKKLIEVLQRFVETGTIESE